MNLEAQYPLKIWDGLTQNSLRSDVNLHLDPSGDDWDQVVVEVIATQRRVEQLGTTLIQLSRTTPADFELVAGETIHLGQPIYVKQANARAYRARALFEEASRVRGFCKAEVTTGNMFGVTSGGRLELADWSVPLGGAVLLTPGVIYYLSDVTGQMMANSPTTGFIMQVGVAVTTTILDIAIQTRVQL